MLLSSSLFVVLALYTLCCSSSITSTPTCPLLYQLENIDISPGRSRSQMFEAVGPALKIDISDYGQFLSIYKNTSTSYYKAITHVIEYIKTKDAKKLREFLVEKQSTFRVSNKAFINTINELIQELDRKQLHPTCASNQGNPPKQTEPTIDQKPDSKPVNSDTAKSTTLPAALTTNIPTVNPIEPVANMPPHPTTGSTTQSSLAHQHSAWKRLIELRDLAKRDELGLDEKIYRIFRGSRAITTTAMSAGNIYLTIIDEAKRFLRAPEREYKFVDFLACTLVSKKRAKKGMKARLFSVLRGFYQARIVAPFANTTKFPLLASLDEIKKLAKNPDTLCLWIDLFLYPKDCKIRNWGYYFHMVAEVFSEYFKTNSQMVLLKNLTILQAITYDKSVPIDSFTKIGHEIRRNHLKLDTFKPVKIPVAVWDQLELIKKGATNVDNGATNKLLVWKLFQALLNRFDHNATTTHLCPELVAKTLAYTSGLISPTNYIEFLFKLAMMPNVTQVAKFPILEIICEIYKNFIMVSDQHIPKTFPLLTTLENIKNTTTSPSLRQVLISMFMQSFEIKIYPTKASFSLFKAIQTYLCDMNLYKFTSQLTILLTDIENSIQLVIQSLTRELYQRIPDSLFSNHSYDERLSPFTSRHPKLRHKWKFMPSFLHTKLRHCINKQSTYNSKNYVSLNSKKLLLNGAMDYFEAFQSSESQAFAITNQQGTMKLSSDTSQATFITEQVKNLTDKQTGLNPPLGLLGLIEGASSLNRDEQIKNLCIWFGLDSAAKNMKTCASQQIIDASLEYLAQRKTIKFGLFLSKIKPYCTSNQTKMQIEKLTEQLSQRGPITWTNSVLARLERIKDLGTKEKKLARIQEIFSIDVKIKIGGHPSFSSLEDGLLMYLETSRAEMLLSYLGTWLLLSANLENTRVYNKALDLRKELLILLQTEPELDPDFETNLRALTQMLDANRPTSKYTPPYSSFPLYHKLTTPIPSVLESV